MRRRVIAVPILAAAMIIFTTAARLEPDPSGLGTHCQLGLPPCGLLTYLGVPCYTCGMTTAFAHMARLEVVAALRAQPFGVVVYLLIAVAAGGALVTLVLGTDWSFILWRIPWAYVLGALLGMCLAAWVYKILSLRPAG